MTPYYEDDSCTIYHGDCRDVLPGLTADLVFADPPYGVGLKYGGSYVDTNRSFTGELNVLLCACAPLVLVTPGIRNLWTWPAPTWVLCWGKPGSTRRSDLGGFNEWEPVLVYGKRRVYNDFLRLPDGANHADGATDGHPCPKPMALLRWLVEKWSDSGQTIVDPFLGSGTTLRAAKDLGRRAIGIEIEERYCEIAANRLAQEVLPLEANHTDVVHQPDLGYIA